MEAMPSSNLKPEGEDEKLVANRTYRTTYMFRLGNVLEMKTTRPTPPHIGLMMPLLVDQRHDASGR